MAKRFLVNCPDYNGYDTDFVMRPEDFDWRNSLGTEYIKIDDVDVKRNRFTRNGKLYIVHSDWSVSQAEEN
jgi:hypothetical protein